MTKIHHFSTSESSKFKTNQYIGVRLNTNESPLHSDCVLVGFQFWILESVLGGARREEERRTPNTRKESRLGAEIVSGVSRTREQNIRMNRKRLAKVLFVTPGENKGRGEREGTGDLATGGI